ncbi:hypothetical protein [Nesterenkonia haasae]|uniref:hypothetical protein n=1 Tax=Nesterenkonia haasae TaxID=2587813 RepID=UPI001391E6FA|nr:hypothetical protein [Nesterenkonia haasae]NDK31182.1 hypothetical protein [Nesterenkonia haasae]
MIHFDAIRDMITDEAVKVYIGKARLSNPPTTNDFPYVAIRGSLPTHYSGTGPDEPTLADLPSSWRATIRLTYAAVSPNQMQWLLPRVRDAIDRKVPVIEGFTCERIRLSSLQPIDDDESMPLSNGRYPIYGIDELTLIAQRN